MAGEDKGYLELVRRMYCCVEGCRATPCEAHHPRVGVVGLAQRGHDRTAIPLCTRHHGELHSLSGNFKSWDGVSLREWQQDRIHDTRGLLVRVEDVLPAGLGEDVELEF